MFLQIKNSRDLVKIVDFQELIDPNSEIVHAKDQEGQEEQETDTYQKEDLVFPSGENLPRCWLDANYQTAHAA
ncbi:MAG: acetyltransferase [Sphaerospermopsis sp.]|uniref:acetyltransferase n=1 Tax=Sphaerospermopsis sp. LEGE 00249 TaxID=1380707 RepID=UPI00164DD180|nr:acetyltransferase [Sphaerospermopsis sp. LEGE 00249]MBC5794553.1 acetyltransferase [Sphaerospermopsis sp. LEGE 00249]MEB3150649.1 acetyltransferase [Sphaerospermopsis sp.]